MSHRPAWAPDDIDIERPAPARMYDYYLGGRLLNAYILPGPAGGINTMRPRTVRTRAVELR
jgi:hypothetical protein